MVHRMGRLIAFYGINNLGKSTQARMLVDRLKSEKIEADYLKFPLYDFEPTGPVLNGYLRGGNPHGLTPNEFQLVMTMNRLHYDRFLAERLAAGAIVVAEDYRGTGLAWGMATGANTELLKKLNSTLCYEDLVFLLDGRQFTDAREAGHVHETDDDLMSRAREAHKRLAMSEGWTVLDANEPIETIHERVWDIVMRFFPF